jgi:serine protease Do
MTSAMTATAFGPLAAEASRLVEALRRSVVVIRSGQGHGSGLIWGSEGVIVTNHHVVARDRAEVELTSGHRFTATVVARDPQNDLAALRLPARDPDALRGYPAAPLGDSTALRVGELIIAVGHPFGVLGAASLGIVSAIGRHTWMGRAERELLQADVALAPGSSGGPLANAAGGVVGIASMILSPGIAVAIPSHVVCRFVARITATRPYQEDMV